MPSNTGYNNVHVYTVVTTNLHTLRWHLFVQPVLIRNRARPRIQRALDYSVQFGQAEINRPRAVYSRKYGNCLSPKLNFPSKHGPDVPSHQTCTCITHFLRNSLSPLICGQYDVTKVLTLICVKQRSLSCVCD